MPSREGSRVFLGNLPYNVRERDIERFFERYGRVQNIFIKSGKYGFCEFDDYRDADDAVYKLNGCDLNGERITVEHARGGKRSEGRRGDRNGGGRRGGRGKYGPPTRTNYRIIVENLSSRVSWQDLKDVMRRAGEVTFADAHNDKRNEGVVEFISRRDMERAIEKFDNHEIQGRRIKLVRDRSTSRSRSRSGSRSSYSRSRSRSSSRSRSAERKRRSASRESRSRRRRSSSHEKVDRRRSRSSSRGSRKDEGEDYAAARDDGKRSHSPEDVDQRDQENSKRRRSDQSPEHRENNEEGEMSADEPPRNASPREEEVDADPPPPGDDE